MSEGDTISVVRLLRFLFGYVEFFAYGGFPERFINLCAARGIPLWDLRTKDGGLLVKTTIGGYRSIRPAAVKSGMRLKVRRRIGIPFFLWKYRRRAGLLCGTVFFLCVLMVMSNMLWSIEITGNQKVTDDEIIAVLAENGVRIGVLAKNIDTVSARLNTMSTLDDVAWIAVNILGSKVSVEVRERNGSPTVLADSTPCDVISTSDGQLITLEAYAGTPVKKVGSAVIDGDVLISGIVQNKNGTFRFRHAQGYAVVRAEKRLSAAVGQKSECFARTGCRYAVRLNLFGIEFPVLPMFGDVSKAEVFTCERQAELNSVRLPFSVKLTCAAQYEKKQRTLTQNERALLCLERLFDAESGQLQYCDISEKKLALLVDEKNVGITADYVYTKSAGIAEELLIDYGTEESEVK